MYKLWAALILSAWAAWGFAIANVTSPAISAAAYNGSVYLYYVGMANATAPGIEGVIVGPPQRPAPLPPSPAFTAGPYLRLLDNGSLALLWTSIELGPVPAAVLKMSVLGRGGWGPPALLTANGTVFNYASDGRYIYALWSPLFSPVPINATVLMFSADGALLRLCGGQRRCARGVGREALLGTPPEGKTIVFPCSLYFSRASSFSSPRHIRV
ncbi:hypothetical protein [Thermoproteus tenax]|uniref:Uncharacterized protein n=1 Tax=Thermoproteus tenax (strain ATCC 35583 / DSM 2078 / JCM 9277 / NBRC 100435 / Kra 1) TaxID=768679 RepID=G4RK13_THETK|nr:hypothetical protein [Thermoproteus tenax]CCC81908.1 hypothetical protein TTX_1274 [Thermoproteus tenax Kra 1]